MLSGLTECIQVLPQNRRHHILLTRLNEGVQQAVILPPGLDVIQKVTDLV